MLATIANLRIKSVTYNWCKKSTKDHYCSNESEACSIVDLQISCTLLTESKIMVNHWFRDSSSKHHDMAWKALQSNAIGSNKGLLTRGGKKGMNDGKSGSSPSGSSTTIPSSAFLILCCILSLRIYIKNRIKYQKVKPKTNFQRLWISQGFCM